MLKIIVNENIAYADDAFNKLGDEKLLPGRNISRDLLRNPDIIIIRSITKLSEEFA
jgi:erythronate-4-phosphate dehydrogenase